MARTNEGADHEAAAAAGVPDTALAEDDPVASGMRATIAASKTTSTGVCRRLPARGMNEEFTTDMESMVTRRADPESRPAVVRHNRTMTAILASSWAFSPWRDEASSTTAAYLRAIGATSVDVIRGDLDGVLPRESPRPVLDARIARAHSLPTPAQPATTWTDIEAYAGSVAARVSTWRAEGARWDRAYTGPAAVADHVAFALLRTTNEIPAWTAHLTELPTHTRGGKRLDGVVPAGPFRDICRVALGGLTLRGNTVGDWTLALIAARADTLIVASAELRDLILDAAETLGDDPTNARRPLAERIKVWVRPVAARATWTQVGAANSARRARAAARRPLTITAQVDSTTLPVLQPVLEAYALLPAADQAQVQLRLLSTSVTPLAEQLRRHGLEGRVAVEVDTSAAMSAQRAAEGDFALVLDRATPEGTGWSAGDLSELADHTSSGTPVILVCPQDSPRTSERVAEHLPTDHPTAALVLLSRLAAGRAAAQR